MIHDWRNCCAVHRSFSFVRLQAFQGVRVKEFCSAIFRCGDKETTIFGELHIINGLLMF